MTRSPRATARSLHDAPASICRQRPRHARTLSRDRRVAAFRLCRCSVCPNADRARAAGTSAREDAVTTTQSGANEWTDYQPMESTSLGRHDAASVAFVANQGESVAKAVIALPNVAPWTPI